MGSLSARIEELKEYHACCSYGDTKDSPVLEEEVLGSSSKDDDEYFIAVEALHSSLDVPIVSTFDGYSDEE